MLASIPTSLLKWPRFKLFARSPLGSELPYELLDLIEETVLAYDHDIYNRTARYQADYYAAIGADEFALGYENLRDPMDGITADSFPDLIAYVAAYRFVEESIQEKGFPDNLDKVEPTSDTTLYNVLRDALL
jgi:hypothetical protein